MIPIIVSSPKDGAAELMDLMACECSSKEVVMAAEEAVETIHRRLQSRDDNEDEDDEESAQVLSSAKQMVRIVQAYTSGKVLHRSACDTPVIIGCMRLTAIPRLPKWRTSPADAVESRVSELSSALTLLSSDCTGDEACDIVAAIVRLGSALRGGADDKTKVRFMLSCIGDTVQ